MVDTSKKDGPPGSNGGRYPRPVLQLDHHAYTQILAIAYDGLPLEACGLLAGQPGTTARCERFYAIDNASRSSKVYSFDDRQYVRATRDADEADLDIIGVMHSHTHTDAYPSPTDIAQAPDPSWHYVIVSLRQEMPVLRSYRIADGKIAEEPVVVVGR